MGRPYRFPSPFRGCRGIPALLLRPEGPVSDVYCRVPVSVDPQPAGTAPESPILRLRFSFSVPAPRAGLGRVPGINSGHFPAGLIPPCSPVVSVLGPGSAPGCSGSVPALAATPVPGFSIVPAADRVMFPIFRSSTAMASNRLANRVVIRWRSFRFLTRFLRHFLARAFTRFRLRRLPFLLRLTARPGFPPWSGPPLRG